MGDFKIRGSMITTKNTQIIRRTSKQPFSPEESWPKSKCSQRNCSTFILTV